MQKSDYIMKNIPFRAEISPDLDSTMNSGPEGLYVFRGKNGFCSILLGKLC